jgi:hypothetical protein
VSSLLSGPLGAGLSDAQRAARAWYAANGDRERAHTTGVWLRRADAAGVDPVMVVRVDSGLLASEMGTNKDIYLSRLSFHGVRISNIRFEVGQRPQQASRLVRRKDEQPPATAAELTDEERRRVDEACSPLPDGLRESVSRAMCASLLREKSHTTQED